MLLEVLYQETGGFRFVVCRGRAIAITEASKELVALGMLIETARDGIPLEDHRKHEVAFIQRWESGYFHFYHGGSTSTCETHGVSVSTAQTRRSG